MDLSLYHKAENFHKEKIFATHTGGILLQGKTVDYKINVSVAQIILYPWVTFQSPAIKRLTYLFNQPSQKQSL